MSPQGVLRPTVRMALRGGDGAIVQLIERHVNEAGHTWCEGIATGHGTKPEVPVEPSALRLLTVVETCSWPAQCVRADVERQLQRRAGPDALTLYSSRLEKSTGFCDPASFQLAPASLPATTGVKSAAYSIGR